MDDDAAAELARLRERAYGRTADIAGDAAALQRLRELETRAVRPPSVAPGADDEDESAPDAPGPAETDPRVALTGGDAERPYLTPRRWPRWGRPAAVAMGAVGLVAATAAVTLSIPRDVPRYPNATEVTGLSELVPLRPQNEPDSRRYADFRGFSVFTNTVGTPADPNPVRCLSIVSPEEAADPTIGETLSTCGAGPFPVSVTVVVSSLSPPAARQAYAPGTAINFTLGESGVEVWVADR